MRNIMQYPITVEEIIKSVELAIQKEENTRSVGGVDTYSLSLLLRFLDQQKARLQLFLYEEHQREFPGG